MGSGQWAVGGRQKSVIGNSWYVVRCSWLVVRDTWIVISFGHSASYAPPWPIHPATEEREADRGNAAGEAANIVKARYLHGTP